MTYAPARRFGGLFASSPPRRRAAAAATGAAATGASIFVLGLGLFVGGFATARGPTAIFDPGAVSNAPVWQSGPAVPAASGADAPEPPHRAKRSSGFGGGPAVCVRLCDGFFFPAATTVGGDAACAAQCPDAPVALYSKTSDNIADAVSLTGARYSALPVANRHQASYDNTCTCHRDLGADRSNEILHDPTLRKGDLVMTATGFVVYEGAKTGVASAGDFVSVSQAPNLSKDTRATLSAMERAGSFTRRNGAAVASVPPPAPAKRQKGVVTVDDGPSNASTN